MMFGDHRSMRQGLQMPQMTNNEFCLKKKKRHKKGIDILAMPKTPPPSSSSSPQQEMKTFVTIGKRLLCLDKQPASGDVYDRVKDRYEFQ